jgi:hypothetical protein
MMQQDHVAVTVSVLEDDNTFTLSMDDDSSSSLSPLKDCVGPDSTRLALPLAGPVIDEEDTDVDDKEKDDDAKEQDAEHRKIGNRENAAIANKCSGDTGASTTTAAMAMDMNGARRRDDYHNNRVKMMRIKSWKLVCVLLTSAALVLNAAAVVVTLVYGQRGGKPATSHPKDATSSP